MEKIMIKSRDELEEEIRIKQEIIESSLDARIYKSMKTQVNTLIDDNKWLRKELSIKEKEYKSLEDKYEALKSSKLGKLTLSYWEHKRKKSKN